MSNEGKWVAEIGGDVDAWIADALHDLEADVDESDQLRARALVRNSFLAGLRPAPQISVSEWADAHRMMGQKDLERGRWKTKRTPYLREILDSMSARSPVELVALQFGAQLGKTETLLNFVGYVIHQNPQPIVFALPDRTLVEKFSRQRMQAAIDATPVLRALVTEPRARDGVNNLISKEFPGGVINFVQVNVAAQLRSSPAGCVAGDELDAWETDVQGEGDPLHLLLARMRNARNPKAIFASTPTLAGHSRIERLMARTDQRRHFVPCPECGHMQVLTWSGVRWEKGQPETARYACAECGVLIEHGKKTWMLERGEWRATAVSKEPGWRGYHLSSLYSPIGWYTWEKAAREWERAQETRSQADQITFFNTVLAETWRLVGDVPDYELLFHRRESYRVGVVPPGPRVLTMAVDVQKNRLEWEVKGWGPRFENWSIDYGNIFGDPSSDEPWIALSDLRARLWPTASGGTLPIDMCAIDSGGHFTQQVYMWARNEPRGRVIATQGRAHQTRLLGQPTAVDIRFSGKRVRRGVMLWPVGTNVAKDELYGWLNQKPPLPGKPTPRGFAHWPKYEMQYFVGLCAEERKVTTDRGAPRVLWELRPNVERNEPLDLAVLNRAAAAALLMDRWSDQKWLSLGATIETAPASAPGIAEAPPPVEPPRLPPQAGPDDAAPPAPAPKPPPKPRGSSFLGNRWRPTR